MSTSLNSYNWFIKKDMSGYSGKWVAIIDENVVASGKNVEKVLKEVNKRYPDKRPFLTKIRSKLSIL